MERKRRNILIGTGAAVALTLVFFVYFRFNPSDAGFFPKCPSLLLTGYKCPGCGSQRAVHQLLHGHLGEAFRQNMLMVCYLPYLIVGAWMEYLGGKRRHPRFYRRFFGKTAIFVNFTVIVLYTVLRNILNI